MSLIGRRKTKCQHCGKEYEYDYVESIDVHLNPELREKVLNASIFLPKCPNCGIIGRQNNKLVYHDQKNNFMVCLNTFDNLMCMNKELETNTILKQFDKVFENMTICGATNILDLIINIVSLENGLDYRVVKILLRFCSLKYYQDAVKNNEKLKQVQFVGLEYIDSEEEPKISLCVGKDDNSQMVYWDFPYEWYEHFYNKYKERLDQFDTFVFDDIAMDRFLEQENEDISNKDLNKLKVIIGIDGDENYHIASINDFLFKKVKVGDQVILKDENDDYRCLISVLEIKDIDAFTYPRDYNSLPIVQCLLKEVISLNKEANGSDLENNSFKKLIEWEENGKPSGSKQFPVNVLNSLKVYVIDKVYDLPKFKEYGKIMFKENKSRSSQLQKMEYISKQIKNNRLYMQAYSDISKLPEGNGYTIVEVDFNTLASILKNDARYYGIIINPENENIEIGFDTIETYIKYQTMTNSSALKNLLTELKEDEIQYISEDSFRLIKDVYFKHKTPKDLEKEYNLSEEKVGALLDNGYYKMMQIVYEKF